MPTLDKHPGSKIIKMLLMGDPGAGKTGGLASLAHAGYNLNIIDLDNKLDILINQLMDPKSPYDKEAWKRVRYVTLTEKFAGIGGTMGAPKSFSNWNRIGATMNKFEDLGSVYDWGPKDILVVDSLTAAGVAAFNFASGQNMGNRNQDNRMNYFHAQNYLENLAIVLASDDVKCNVILNCHIHFIGDETDGTLHGYPTTIGRALSAKYGMFFSNMLLVKSVGNQRKIFTSPTSRIEVKTTAPLRVKSQYDLPFGLSEFFKDALANA